MPAYRHPVFLDPACDPVTHIPPFAQDGSHLLHVRGEQMEALADRPAHAPRGLALIAHPQPILGGSAMHKVPHFLAQALRDAGWLTVRPNFRGVGRSTGAHDAGHAETEDMMALLEALRATYAGLPLALVGVSFGAFVLARAARRLADAGKPAWRTCLAAMPYGTVEGGRSYDTPRGLPGALVIHGERDERVPLPSILEWARPDGQPVTVIPGAGHLFNGKLPLLRSLVLGHLRDG